VALTQCCCGTVSIIAAQHVFSRERRHRHKSGPVLDYPNIGVDDQTQFDMFDSLPGEITLHLAVLKAMPHHFLTLVAHL